MQLNAILEAIDMLSPEERERVKRYLEQQEQTRLENIEQTLADLDAAIAAFWGDSSTDEIQAIFEAMRTKSTSSDKGL
jgi:hypothetical protein